MVSESKVHVCLHTWDERAESKVGGAVMLNTKTCKVSRSQSTKVVRTGYNNTAEIYKIYMERCPNVYGSADVPGMAKLSKSMYRLSSSFVRTL